MNLEEEGSMLRFEIEKFTGKGDFGVWRIKMRAMLVQQGLDDALKPAEKGKGEGADEKADPKKQELMEKAYNAIVLCLHDKVLREVSKETTAAGIWCKLESLYMNKSLANRLYMKRRLYSYKFVKDQAIGEQLDQFNRFVYDLENIDVSLSDENKAIILLNALPKSFKQLKDAMLYGREATISLLEVQSALKTKELQKLNNGESSVPGEILNVKGSFADKKSNGKFQLQKEDGQEGKETRKCHWCHKPGHLKKNCFDWKRKQKEEAEKLNTVDSNSSLSSWIMSSGCSFHMCPHREWFQELQKDHGTVDLGNNQRCEIKGIGSIKLRVKDGSLKILTGVRYIPDIRRNLISLGMLEQKGFTFMSSGGHMRVMKRKQTVMEAERKSSLYHLLAVAVVGNACDRNGNLGFMARKAGSCWGEGS